MILVRPLAEGAFGSPSQADRQGQGPDATMPGLPLARSAP